MTALAQYFGVAETTTTGGVGTLTLAGALTDGSKTYLAAQGVIPSGTKLGYAVLDLANGETEWGEGTYTESGGTRTLSRDAVIQSSNSGSLVSFTAGAEKVVLLGIPVRVIQELAGGGAVSSALAEAVKTAQGHYVRAVQSSSQSLGHNVWTTLIFDAATIDPNGILNTTNGKIEATEAGLYRIRGSTSITADNTDHALAIRVTKNGTAPGQNSYSNGSPTGQPLFSQWEDVVELNGTTDYAELQAYQAGSGASAENTSATQTLLIVERIG